MFVSLAALVLVILLCVLASTTLGPAFHHLMSPTRRVQVPDDASALLDPSLSANAPCDTCDGVGAGHVDGELITCPVCRGTGIVET